VAMGVSLMVARSGAKVPPESHRNA
jgi:hypothetical protein